MLTIWLSPSSNFQRNSFYVKDISDFLQKINAIEFVPHNSYLISLESLYTSIPNAGDIKAVKAFLENYPKRTVAAKVITAFLVLILALNSFVFNSHKQSANKRLCYGNHLCTIKRQYINRSFWKKSLIFSFKRFSSNGSH